MSRNDEERRIDSPCGSVRRATLNVATKAHPEPEDLARRYVEWVLHGFKLCTNI